MANQNSKQLREARENLRQPVTIGFCFTSHWLRSSASFLSQSLSVVILWCKTKVNVNYFRPSSENRSTTLSDWFKRTWRHFLAQSEVKAKSIVTRSREFSRASGQLREDFAFDSETELSVSLAIGQSDDFLWFSFDDTHLKTPLPGKQTF